MVFSWLRRWRAHRTHGISRRPSAYRNHYRLWGESLEDRTVPSTINWINPAGGNWNVPGNWDAGQVPGLSDDAVIAMSGITVTHNTGIDSVHSLNVTNSTFSLTGGTLANATVQGAGTVNLAGGTLRSDTIAAGTILTGSASGGTLDGVTLNGTLDLTSTNAAIVHLVDGLTLNGTLTLGNSSGSTFGQVYLDNTQTLGGSGAIVFGGDLSGNNALYLEGLGITATFGPNLTIHGKNGRLDASSYGSGSYVNNGTIAADVAGGSLAINLGTGGSNSGILEAPGGSLSVSGTTWSSPGTLQASNSGSLNLSGSYSLNTTLTLNGGSTLTLGGTFTLGAGNTFRTSGGTVNLTGTLNNSGSTLNLNATTGSWNLAGGTLMGGTVTETGGAVLVATSNFTNMLSGVTLNGNLDLASTNDAILHLVAGLTLNGTLLLGSSSGSNFGQVFLDGTQTLDGSGAIAFGSDPFGDNALYLEGFGITATLGPNLTIHGNNGRLDASSYGSGSYINTGTIAADVAGGTISIDFGANGSNRGALQAQGGSLAVTSGTWSNSGSLSVTAGSLSLGGSWSSSRPISATGGALNFAGTWSTSSAISVSNATVNFGGTFATVSINSFTRTGGTVNLIGTLNNSGSTLNLNATTGSWNLAGGTLMGGTVTETGAALLVATSNITNTLSGVTLNGNLDLASTNDAILHLVGGLTLNGTLLLGSSSGSTFGQVYLDGTQTLGGSGAIVFGSDPFGDNALYLEGTGITATLGPTLTIHGTNGQITAYPGLSGSYINQGTIAADAAGGAISIDFGANGSNRGTLQAQGGSLAITSGTWSNGGSLSVTAGSLSLGGTFTLGAGSTFTRTGGTVNLTGTLNNSGSTLNLNATTGSWNLAGGTLVGGTVTTTGSAVLVATSNSNNTLNGVTLNGTLDLASNNIAVVHLVGGLTLNGTLLLGSSSGSTFGQVYLDGTQTLGGSGAIVFGGDPSGNNALYLEGTGITATFGPNLTIHGNNGRLDASSYGSGSSINQGTIAADVAGGTISIGGTWTNNGSVKAQNAGTLSAAAPTNYSAGTLTGGTWQVFDTSTLRVTLSTGLITNAAAVLVDGPNANFYQAATGTTDALAPFASNAAAGSFTVQNGHAFTTTGNFSDAGTLIVGPGSTVIVTGTYSQAGTLNVLAAGTMSVTGAVANFSGGTLTGGIFDLLGTLQFPGAAISTNAATIVLDGPGAAIVDPSANDALRNLAVNTAAGRLTIQNNHPLTLAGTFNNAGSVTVGAGSTLTAMGTWSQTGTLNIQTSGAVLLKGGGSAGGSLSEAGSLTIAAGITVTVTGSYSQSGSLLVPAGAKLVLSGSFTNFAGGTLTGGIFDLLGTLQFPGAAISTNAATIVLDGPGAAIVDPSANDALRNLAANTGVGRLTIQNNHPLTLAGTFSNAGSVTIGAGSTLTVTGSDTNTGTLTILASGALNLLGGGSSSGTISNGGSLSLAAGITYASSGSYSQTGTLTIPDTAMLSLLGTFANFNGATLSGGTYDILGIFQFAGAAVITNTATVILDGADAMILDQNGNSGLAGTFATNAVGASLTLRNGANLTTAGAFENDGTLTVGAGSALVITGSDTDTGTLTILAGGTLELQGGGSSSGTLSNAGTLLIDVGSVFTSSRAYSQTGTVVVADTGTLSLLGTFANFAGGTLTTGTYDIFGTFRFMNAAVAANAATLVLDGPDAQVLDQNGTNGLASFATNAAGGSLTIQNGANLATGGSFTNAGSWIIGAGSTFATVGNVTNTGNLTLGVGGFLQVGGNYTQSAAAGLTMFIDGPPASNQFGQLAINGTAMLGGTLTVTFQADYTPSNGDAFPFLTAASVTGTFATVNVINLDPSFQLTVSYDPTDVTLTVMTANSPGIPRRRDGGAVAGSSLRGAAWVDAYFATLEGRKGDYPAFSALD